ncbi:MAG: metallophosphoesterase [Thermoproteota archaeon]|nr:metallophosphoesterase [Thermoproteota archaeon]
MIRRRSKTLVFHAIFSLICMVMAVQAVEMKEEEEKQDSVAYAAAAPSSGFNFAAAGDWACTSHTTDTINNIVDKNPELVLGLGDYSYEDTADCWFDIIQPIDNIMKIAIGNHEVEEQSKLLQYMNYFNLTEQYYSFDYQNVHFIALATESEYLNMSTDKAKEQLAFVRNDLEKASLDPNVDWIIPFFHRMMYYEENESCSIVGEHDHNLEDIYHPLFEKYGVHLVLQAHSHTYERTYPLRDNPLNSEDPIVTSKDSNNKYTNIDGLVIATVGTGGIFTCKFVHTDPKLAPIQYENLFGFLNVDVSSDGTTLVGTFYENNGDDGKIKDKFTITKSKQITK